MGLTEDWVGENRSFFQKLKRWQFYTRILFHRFVLGITVYHAVTIPLDSFDSKLNN